MKTNRRAGPSVSHVAAALVLVAAAVFTPSVLAQVAVPSHFGGESWMPQVAGGDASGAALTAAEVAADRDLWIRSGMASAVQGEAGPDLNSPEYRERFAVYSALRDQRALARQESEPREAQVASRPDPVRAN